MKINLQKLVKYSAFFSFFCSPSIGFLLISLFRFDQKKFASGTVFLVISLSFFLCALCFLLAGVMGENVLALIIMMNMIGAFFNSYLVLWLLRCEGVSYVWTGGRIIVGCIFLMFFILIIFLVFIGLN